MSFNKVILVGNVGKDPEIRRFDTTVKASFSLATSETYTPRGGEKVTQTEWHNIVAWRRLAELAENYIRKGSQILVEGKLRYRSYDDRDGNKRYVVEVEADMIQLLGKRPDSQNQGYQGGNQWSQGGAPGGQGGSQWNQGGAPGGQGGSQWSQGGAPGGQGGSQLSQPGSHGYQETPPQPHDPDDDITARDSADDLPF